MTYRRVIEAAGPEWTQADVIRSGGPERVHYDDQPDPNYKPRPAGFLADIEPTPEPILWEGDNA